MLQPIQGPKPTTGTILARVELVGPVTKGHAGSFAVDAATGELTHRQTLAADNASQQYVWGVALENGVAGEMVTFVLKGIVWAVQTNAAPHGNIAIGDGLTRRAVDGHGNALAKAVTGDVILASATKAITTGADSGYIMFDGIQGRFTTA